MNESFIIDQLRKYYLRQEEDGWQRTDPLDGNLALSASKGSKNPTAQGKESRPTKGSSTPNVNRSKMDRAMAVIKQSSPELYHAGRVEFSPELTQHKDRFMTLVRIMRTHT